MPLTPRAQRALTGAKRLAAQMDGVTAIDYGVVYKDHVGTTKRGIRFHVARKLPLNRLASTDVLPPSIDGIRCDVVEVRYAPHAGSPQNAHGAFDPLRPGVSIGNLNRGTTGTLGALVRGTNQEESLLLSNWHVLCGSVAAVAGEEISQPSGPDAGGTPARVVASLSRFAPLGTGYDAAVAEVRAGVGLSTAIHGLDLSPAGTATPALSMHLVKSGLMTGVTHAIIDGVDGTYKMNYGPYGDRERWMDGIRLVVDPASPAMEISLEGDSGSLWLDSEGRAVALHFAGEDGLGPLAEYAVAHPIKRVFELLQISL